MSFLVAHPSPAVPPPARPRRSRRAGCPAAAAVALLLAATGCGAHNANNRPPWVTGGANLEHPDFVFVVGNCKGQLSEDAARQCALADAQQQARNVLNVAGGLVREQHAESRWGSVTRGPQTQLTIVHDAWLLMAVPRKQMKVNQ